MSTNERDSLSVLCQFLTLQLTELGRKMSKLRPSSQRALLQRFVSSKFSMAQALAFLDGFREALARGKHELCSAKE